MGAYISSITEASWSREGEHRAKVRYAAECLISPTPAWLTKVLSDFAFEISTQHNIEHMSLTRKDLFEAVSSAQRMAIGSSSYKLRTGRALSRHTRRRSTKT